MPPPAEQMLTLGAKQASYRAYRPTEACGVEPRIIAADLESMNRLLIAFLTTTSAGVDGVWADEHIALLEEATQKLPPALSTHDAALAALGDCNLSPQNDENVRTGLELLAQAKRRLSEAPELLAVATAKRDFARWREAQPAQQQSAREQWCPKKGKSRTLFYAFDEQGRTEWLFCDGSKVIAAPGSPPQHVSADGSSSSGKKAKAYLDAAARYPPSEINRAPRLPPRKLSKPKMEERLPEPEDELG